MKMKGRHTIKEAEYTQEFNSSICFNPSLVEDFHQILDPVWIWLNLPNQEYHIFISEACRANIVF